MSVVFVDKDTLKPACVMLQIVLGGDRELLHKHFDSDDWEVGCIDRMKPVPADLCARAAEIRREIRDGAAA